MVLGLRFPMPNLTSHWHSSPHKGTKANAHHHLDGLALTAKAVDLLSDG